MMRIFIIYQSSVTFYLKPFSTEILTLDTLLKAHNFCEIGDRKERGQVPYLGREKSEHLIT